MLLALLTTMALAGTPEDTLNFDATLTVGFRPGMAAQADYGLWKGFFVGGRITSQQEAYIAAQNLGDFTETGTWHHGIYAGGGIRATVGRNDRWDIEYGIYAGSEFSFVRETVVYRNSGQQPPYSVRDKRFYQSWQVGFTPFLPTLRFRFARNHGIVFQPMYSLSHPLMIERAYVSIGWTSRWGGTKVGSGGTERGTPKRDRD